jgi:hypothetical protein
MPSSLKDVQEKASAIADLFHTPFLTLVWRAGLVVGAGVGIYAFNAYKHDMITSDQTVKDLLTETASTRALITTHEVFIQEQSKANAKLDAYFQEARKDRQDITTSLTKLETHLSDQDSRLDRIERKQDYPSK